MIQDDTGVIVIGRNEGERLVRCLQSVIAYSRKVVYVDSGSTDDSIFVARELDVPVVNLDLAQPFTAARARNEGFAALKSLHPEIEFVQFVDGDCELVKGWLDVATAFIRKQDDIAVVCGRRREINPSASIYNQLCEIEWESPMGEALECGGDSLMRVLAFEAVQGFRNELIAGEEPELCLRLRESGWRIWRIDAEMTLHDAAIDRFAQWWLRAVRAGYGYADVYFLHRDLSLTIYTKQIARAVFWAAGVPLLTVVACLFNPKLVIVGLIYPLQTCKVALSKGPMSKWSWTYALLMMIAKFAEFQGMVKFCSRRILNTRVEAIEYKKLGAGPPEPDARRPGISNGELPKACSKR